MFFPCHNEVENVERVVREAHRHLAALTEDFEIIVVDDGSTDGTRERAEAVANTDSRIRVVAHPTNLGYGHALRTGFKNARKPLVTYTDGDGQFSLADLPNMLAALNGHGFVLGYRLQRADPPHRRVNAWLWTAFVRMMLGINVRDLDCGFKLFRREVVQDLEFIAGRGAVISAELIAKVDNPNVAAIILPGGGLKEGETHEEGAARELFEETGLIASEFTFVLSYRSPVAAHHVFIPGIVEGTALALREIEEIIWWDGAQPIKTTSSVIPILSDPRIGFLAAP